MCHYTNGMVCGMTISSLSKARENDDKVMRYNTRAIACSPLSQASYSRESKQSLGLEMHGTLCLYVASNLSSSIVFSLVTDSYRESLYSYTIISILSSAGRPSFYCCKSPWGTEDNGSKYLECGLVSILLEPYHWM